MCLKKWEGCLKPDKRFSTDFFDVYVSIETTEYGVNIGRGRVIRKDTKECVPVGPYVLSGNKSKEQIEREIYEDMIAKKMFLLTPPPDWNSNIRKILLLIKGITNKTIKFSMDYEHKSLSSDDFTRLFFRHCIQIGRDTRMIVRKIARLDSSERIELLKTSQDYCDGIETPWTIENEYSLRLQAFDYYINPSYDEIEAYKKNFNRIIKSFD